MGLNTGIEWTTHTLNPWNGCIKVGIGEECANCYAADMDKRGLHRDGSHWGYNTSRLLIRSWVSTLNKARKSAIANNRREMVFVMSMGDIFEASKPLSKADGTKWQTTGQVRDELFSMIPKYPELIFLLLTKRPELVMRTIPDSWLFEWPENVWVGASIGMQKNVRRIGYLQQVRARGGKVFVSAEPLLESVKFGSTLQDIDWVIVGGESETGFSAGQARPMKPEWATAIRDECREAGVPFFFKQWGQHGGDGVRRHKSLNGSLLDGEEVKELPVQFLTPLK